MFENTDGLNDYLKDNYRTWIASDDDIKINNPEKGYYYAKEDKEDGKLYFYEYDGKEWNKYHLSEFCPYCGGKL